MEKTAPPFPLRAKIRFYLSLGYYNLIAPLECKNLRFKVFVNQIRYLIATLRGFKLHSRHTSKLLLKTNFGTFYIRDTCWDLESAAPSFERLDIDHLLHLIAKALWAGKKVLFLDIGAQFGKYTVTIGNRFKRYSKNLSMLAFEPDPENFTLLSRNVKINKLKNVRLLRKAISNKKGEKQFFYYEPQNMIVSFPTSKKIVIRTDTIDDVVKNIPDIENTVIFIKMDIEGHELAALQGGKKLWKKSEKNILLIEDAISSYSPKLLSYLRTNGKFLKKLTTYNSFWRLA